MENYVRVFNPWIFTWKLSKAPETSFRGNWEAIKTNCTQIPYQHTFGKQEENIKLNARLKSSSTHIKYHRFIFSNSCYKNKKAHALNENNDDDDNDVNAASGVSTININNIMINLAEDLQLLWVISSVSGAYL